MHEGGVWTMRAGVYRWKACSSLGISQPCTGHLPWPVWPKMSDLPSLWGAGCGYVPQRGRHDLPQRESRWADPCPPLLDWAGKNVRLHEGEVPCVRFSNRGGRFLSAFCAEGCPAGLRLQDLLRGRAATWLWGRGWSSASPGSARTAAWSTCREGGRGGAASPAGPCCPRSWAHHGFRR